MNGIRRTAQVVDLERAVDEEVLGADAGDDERSGRRKTVLRKQREGHWEAFVVAAPCRVDWNREGGVYTHLPLITQAVLRKARSTFRKCACP